MILGDSGSFSFAAAMNFDGMSKADLESDPDSQAVLTEALSQFYETVTPDDVTIKSITDVVALPSSALRSRQLQASQVHVDFNIDSSLESLGLSDYDAAYTLLSNEMTTFVTSGDYNTAIEQVATEKEVSVTATTSAVEVGPIEIPDDGKKDDDDDDDELGAGAVAGIVIGVVVAAALIVAGVVMWLKKGGAPEGKRKSDYGEFDDVGGTRSSAKGSHMML